jgi:ribosome-associated translation inhibitor RaiA
VFHKKARDIQKERLATAREQLVTFRNAARAQAVKTWTLEVERYRQQRKTLKKRFVQHCRNHQTVEKQDYKSRLNGHKARVAAREPYDLDSDADSDDSQASLLKELDETESQLEKCKKELHDADVGITTMNT